MLFKSKLVDDLRWDEIACAGHPFVQTPGIDRIAREGARFRNAFCTTPLCSPVRASLLTGQYAHNHGIIDNTNCSRQSHELITFPRILHENGYETGYIGKWHMGNDDTARPGFDYWTCMAGQDTSFDPVLNENCKHGLSIERRLAYEESIRIPLLIRHPRLVRPGSIVDDLVASIDLAPTLLELADMKAKHKMDDRSLVRLLAGKRTGDWRKSFLIEYYTDTVFPRLRNMGYRAVRTSRYKYIHYVDLEGMDELYDLKEDPYEMKNVIGDPGLQTTVEKLRADMARLSAAGP